MLSNLSRFIHMNSTDTVKVWGNGKEFDCAILEHAFQQLEMPCPWKFWDTQDVRTVITLAELHGFNPKRPARSKACRIARWMMLATVPAMWPIPSRRSITARSADPLCPFSFTARVSTLALFVTRTCLSCYAKVSVYASQPVLLGPLGIDLYLPTIPAIAVGLGSSEALIQSTISLFILVLGLGGHRRPAGR